MTTTTYRYIDYWAQQWCACRNRKKLNAMYPNDNQTGKRRGANKERKPRVFISGAVSRPLQEQGFMAVYNRFKACEKTLNKRFANVDIYNPMDHCNCNWSWLRCMAVCLRNLRRCDAICLIGGWRKSKGSRIEYVAARAWRKGVMMYTGDHLIHVLEANDDLYDRLMTEGGRK